jgi:hypothetical protein
MTCRVCGSARCVRRFDVNIETGRKHRLVPYTEPFDERHCHNGKNVEPCHGLRSQLGQGNGLLHVEPSGYQSSPREIANTKSSIATDGATAFADARMTYAELNKATYETTEDKIISNSFWPTRMLTARHYQYRQGMHTGKHFTNPTVLV